MIFGKEFDSKRYGREKITVFYNENMAQLEVYVEREKDATVKRYKYRDVALINAVRMKKHLVNGNVGKFWQFARKHELMDEMDIY